MKNPNSTRLNKACTFFGGGGGGGGAPNPAITPELKNIYKGFNTQTVPTFNQFVQGQPLLSTAQTGALDFWQQLPGLIQPLATLEGNLPAQFDQYQQQLGGYQQKLGGLYSGLANTDYLNQIIGSQGALTPEQGRDVTQQTRAAFAARGNVMGNQAIGSELLNRDQYRQQRLVTAFGERAADLGARQGLLGQQAQITGQQAGLTGQQAGLTQMLSTGQQGLQTGALNQLTGVEGAETSSFATLANPLYGLFENAQNAATQLQVASENKQAGIIGGGINAIGDIAGGIGTAL